MTLRDVLAAVLKDEVVRRAVPKRLSLALLGCERKEARAPDVGL